MIDTITISRKKYDQLKDDSNLRRRLEMNGVDNWEGYGMAFEDEEDDEYYDEDQDEEDA